MKIKSVFLLAIASTLLAACGGSAYLDSARMAMDTGQYEKITATPKSNNLDLLIGAQADFLAGQYQRSDELFEVFNQRNIDPTKTSLGAEAAMLVGGQMAGDYKPYMMDMLFVSYYQLWDALAMGDFETARVIINQSYDRQQNMSLEYKKLIENREQSATADALTIDTSAWGAYTDIMNPALTYLAGIYFLNMGEYENARQYLTRAHGMAPHNTYIDADLKAARDHKPVKDTVWVFIETGFAPRLRETRIDMPWFVGNNIQVISVATAYPEIYPYTPVLPHGAEHLADVDAMFLTEFREYQVNAALRAFAKAISNVAVQSATADTLNGWGGLLGTIYTMASTNAETRSWATLPAEIYVMRIKKDKSGLIKLNSDVTLEVDNSGNDLIYIRGADIKMIKL